MDFFSELYHGDIYPGEEIAVDVASDPKYKELMANLEKSADKIDGANLPIFILHIQNNQLILFPFL